MKHTLFKVNKDSVDEWRDWCRFLSEHAEQAKETMRQENCVYERCILFQSADTWYVIGTVAHNNEQQPADMTVKLNRDHKEKRDRCLSPQMIRFDGEFTIKDNYEVLYEFAV